MKNTWAASNLAGSEEIFEALHTGLKVSLIATPRDRLKTCRSDERVSDVLQRNTESYDYIPVVDVKTGDNQPIIGLFHAANYKSNHVADGRIRGIFKPMSEEFIIGPDSRILDFIKDADARPCRLLVSGSNITGLVSLSDLQRLPVRAALFALITGFEITMMDAIRRIYKSEMDWMSVLSPDRRSHVKSEKKKSEETDAFVDTLLFTQFADKKSLIKKRFTKVRTKSSLEKTLKAIEALRNKVAHANEYADSPSQARTVCKTVRELLQLRLEIAEL
ncbi:hypothetical protein [Rhodoplanes sp. Z2-YC6860]|uniref:hypothetical protein n=1 Tax=Rhodoplanes sp. Z2-YC6860 TaxID=674703 RepID=UPI00078E6671|nr:hypothetical protein [Rhodoplanes sp. Z2-YC6860]AMN39058.1 CBS domain containing protein [Rhodoplanes sp. Z2-YC6860]